MSFLAASLPFVSELSASSRTIVLTVLLSSAAAWLFPLRETEEGEMMDEA